MVKTIKVIKTIAKAKKLRNTTFFSAFLPFFYHFPYFLKKPYSDDKNLK